MKYPVQFHQQIPVTRLTGAFGSEKVTILKKLPSHPGFGKTATIAKASDGTGPDTGPDHVLVVSRSKNVCHSLCSNVPDTLPDPVERREEARCQAVADLAVADLLVSIRTDLPEANEPAVCAALAGQLFPARFLSPGAIA